MDSEPSFSLDHTPSHLISQIVGVRVGGELEAPAWVHVWGAGAATSTAAAASFCDYIVLQRCKKPSSAPTTDDFEERGHVHMTSAVVRGRR